MFSEECIYIYIYIYIYMTFINNNEIFSQNNWFDLVLFLVTSFYCTLRILKIIFPESGHSYLKVAIKENFIV